MEAECFGGEETAPYSQYTRSSYLGTNGGGIGTSSGWKRERTRNAFLLVYDRVLPQNYAQNQEPQQQQQLQRPDVNSSVGATPVRFSEPRPPVTARSPANSSSPRKASATLAAACPASRCGGGTTTRAMQGARDTRQQKRRRRRKRFRAKIPGVFLHQIWRENVEFWRYVTTMFTCQMTCILLSGSDRSMVLKIFRHPILSTCS